MQGELTLPQVSESLLQPLQCCHLCLAQVHTRRVCAYHMACWRWEKLQRLRLSSQGLRRQNSTKLWRWWAPCRGQVQRITSVPLPMSQHQQPW